MNSLFLLPRNQNNFIRNGLLVDSLRGRLYSEVKQELAEKGLVPYIPEDAKPFPFESGGNPDFPEIGDCGQGYDAICNVSIKGGGMTDHLNVKIGGRLPNGPYSEWIVSGHE